MRRIATAVGCALLLALMGPADARPPTRVLTVDHLSADWVHRPTPDQRAHWYLVQADIVRDAETGEIVTARARAGLGPCRDGGRFCHVDGLEDFRVVAYDADILLQNAELVLRRRGEVIRLNFLARIYSGGYEESIHPCPGEADAYSSVVRSASATGVVFGRHVSSETDWDREGETMQREIYAC